MKLRLGLLLACLLSAGSLPAAEVTLDSLTVGSRSYRNVRVIGANITDLYFEHSEGLANVKLKYLDPTLQKQFNYDPKRAAAAEAQQENDSRLFQNEVASNITVKAAQAARIKQNQARSSENTLLDPIAEGSPVGKTSPKLSFNSWTAEPPQMADKPILLYFWAPWSFPCRKFNPTVAGLSSKLSSKLAVIGVAASDDLKGDVAPEATPGIPTAMDRDGKFTQAAGVTCVPTIILIDREGKIRYHGHPAAITEAILEKIGVLPE